MFFVFILNYLQNGDKVVVIWEVLIIKTPNKIYKKTILMKFFSLITLYNNTGKEKYEQSALSTNMKNHASTGGIIENVFAFQTAERI